MLKVKANKTVDSQQKVIDSYELILRQIRVMYTNPELHRVIQETLANDFDKAIYHFSNYKKDLDNR